MPQFDDNVESAAQTAAQLEEQAAIGTEMSTDNDDMREYQLPDEW